MAEQPSISTDVHQKLTITPEPSSVAIGVKYTSWLHLKDCIGRISVAPGLALHTIGSILAPFCPGALIALATKDFSSSPAAKIIYCAVAVVTLLLSVGAFYLAHRTRRLDAFRVHDIITMMEVLEADYSLPDSTPLTLKFGVRWDEDHQPRCLNCGKLLKHSTGPAHILFCSDPQCDAKHVLKTDAGQPMTLQEAKAILKSESHSA